VELFALMMHGPRDLGECNFSQKSAIIVGSEGRGVSDRLGAKAVGVRIPTVGVESLNAAMAAGIALHTAHQQRMIAP
jgi:TrmH family RNA methyltransferase